MSTLNMIKPICLSQNNESFLQFHQSVRCFSDQAAKATKIMDAARDAITDDLKKQLNGVFVFKVSGVNYLLDAHADRPLRVEVVEQLPEKVDVTMITDEDTFVNMATGKTKSTSAFMTGKLKIKGNVGLAMKAEKIFKAIKV